jgi:hypothetical protein
VGLIGRVLAVFDRDASGEIGLEEWLSILGEDLEMEERSWYRETKEDFEQRVKDFELTDQKLGTLDKVIAHVKQNNAFGFVETITDHEVVSAEWDSKDFKIYFVIRVEDPNETIDTIREWIEMQSLEDGEYESCGDNGWTVKTLGETMEYGLTDYRHNPISIEEVEGPDLKLPGAKLIAVPA